MRSFGIAALLLAALPASAAAAGFSGPAVGPVPIEFILFGFVLAGVALFHLHTLRIAVTGVIVIALYKIIASPFETGAGVGGFGLHVAHEWVILTNLGLSAARFCAYWPSTSRRAAFPPSSHGSSRTTGRAPSCCWC